MRANEVAELHGFDPVFVNGCEDVDLCLRATERFGGHFAVEPDSVVEHRESKTPGRMRRIRENRRILLERWAGRIPEPNFALYRAAGYDVVRVNRDPAAAIARVVLRGPDGVTVD